MATRFKEDLIWGEEQYVIRVQNSTGIADRFFQKAQESLKEIEFPNIDSDISENPESNISLILLRTSINSVAAISFISFFLV